MISGIYKWTSPSGKSYIGQAINLKKRCREFKRTNCYYTSKGSAIDNARAKYPNWEDWKYEVLEECSIDQLDEREIYWINFYETYKKGYNSTTGGDGTKGRVLTEEQKQKLSERQLKAIQEGKLNEWWSSERLKKQTSERFKNRVWTEEQKQKISDALKGQPLLEETKLKISQSLKEKYASGFKNVNHTMAISKKVGQYDLNGNLIKIYDSLKQAAKAMGKKDSKVIRKACKGLKQSAYGYIWKFE